MNKIKYLIIFVVLLTGLGFSLFQYFSELKAELTQAEYSKTKPANGHVWSEMECTSDVCIKTGSGVGLGTDIPGAKLDVNGQIKLQGGDPGLGKVLTSDADGLATWSIPAGGLPTGINGQTVRNNGATWLADSLLYNNGTNIGIGTVTPTQKLDVAGDIGVSGRILVGHETVSADPSNSVVTKGYLSSFTSPIMKVISGNGVTCQPGTDLLMKCIGNPCMWYDAENNSVSGAIVKVLCGAKLTFDGTPLLINSQHTEGQCTSTSAAGTNGQVVPYGSGKNQCLFRASACPAGWAVTGWGETASGGTCPGYYGWTGTFGSCWNSGCSWPIMSWQLGSAPSCSYQDMTGLTSCRVNGCGVSCKAYRTIVCGPSPLSKIGCY